MKKYEYKAELIDDSNFTWKLTQEGDDGWQVVDIKWGLGDRLGCSYNDVIFMRECGEVDNDR